MKATILAGNTPFALAPLEPQELVLRDGQTRFGAVAFIRRFPKIHLQRFD